MAHITARTRTIDEIVVEDCPTGSVCFSTSGHYLHNHGPVRCPFLTMVIDQPDQARAVTVVCALDERDG